ncbi:MAG: hypothetical protein IJZ29_03290 [Clostridia bacterium]|nr:hypothetical protein [Clostridia bacterium]
MITKKLNYLLAFSLFIFTTLCVLIFSNNIICSNVQAQSLSLYFESAIVTSQKSFKDFTKANLNVYNAFVGQEIVLTIGSVNGISNIELKADDEIIYLDNSNELTGGVVNGNYTTYTKTIKCDSAGEYHITIIGDMGGHLYFDALNLYIYENVESIDIVAKESFISNDEEVEFEFMYNGASELVFDGNINLAISNEVESVEVTSDDFSACPAIISLDSEKLVLDTNLLNSEQTNYKIEVAVGEISTSLDFEVQNLTMPSNIILSANSATYLLSDDIVTYYIYLDKNCKPIISVVDNTNVVELNKYYKVESDRQDYDKVAIELKLNAVTDYTNVLILTESETDYIYKTIGVSVIDEVNSVKVDADKNLYDSNENINFNLIVNGKDDFASNVDWFVNDIQIDKNNADLSLSLEGGTYTIYASIGGVQSNSKTFTVKYSSGNMMFWYILLGVCVVAIIILLLTRKKKGNMSMFASITENIEELIKDINSLEKKYTNKLAVKFYKDITIIKERCWHEYEQNEEQLYGIADRHLQNAYKQMRKILMKKETVEERQEMIALIKNELTSANDALLEYKRICSKASED